MRVEMKQQSVEVEAVTEDLPTNLQEKENRLKMLYTTLNK